MLTFNLNWGANDLKPSHIAKILLTLSDTFKLEEIFTLKSTSMKSPTYQLKGMICYVGAHYITYFRTLPEESKDDLYSIGKWKIYNDD